MTVTMLQNMYETDTENEEDLYNLVEDALDKGKIERSAYATVLASIRALNRIETNNVSVQNNPNTRRIYTTAEVKLVTKSHLEVYDGLKNVEGHLNLMKSMFGETGSQFRNGAQYNQRFHKTLDEGNPNLGQSMPANWADATLELIQDREVQFKNTLDACKAIYEATSNGNMYAVIQKWSLK